MTSPAKTGSKKTKAKVVADSWEDDMDDTSDAGAEETTQPESDSTPISQTPVPSAPPPTPISPLNGMGAPDWGDDTSNPCRPSHTPNDPDKRPEKTDAVARRMIAGALGLKAPKLTEEQKEYNKAIREQEKKKREQERAEEQKKREESEKAKAAIWED